MPDSSLYLVDASPYLFRAYFALPDTMQTKDGRPANVIYGFANFLAQLLAREDLTHVAITFDESLSTSFRNDLYPEYKAQRELPPEELVQQIQDCQRLCTAFGAKPFSSKTYEADDLIGTLADRFRGKVDRMVVVTSDKDLAQLVDDELILFDFAKNRWMDEDGVREHFGVRPDQIVDFLALQGDSVDNIPGVPGVGKKTAAALLEAYDELAEIYLDLDAVAALDFRGAKSTAKKLAENKELAFLSQQLARIVVDAPIEATLEGLKYEGAGGELVELLDELGFDGLRKRVPVWKDGKAGERGA